MSAAQVWRPDAELPDATTWLLEASAGTGKTYQISDLVVRHVAELDVPIDRVLAITFTEAATGELKRRIRGRLRDYHSALTARRADGSPTEDPDPVLARILRSVGEPSVVARRLEGALRGFDLAPISTIHGFCQRMLRELAFDSGQETSLELLQDKGEVLEQLVDDTLCTIYAEVDPPHVATLECAGLTRDLLLEVAQAAGGPVAPVVTPSLPEAVGGLRALLEAHEARVAHLLATWQRHEAAFLEDAEEKRFEKMQGKAAKTRLTKLTSDLQDGDLPRCLKECKDLRAAKLSAKWLDASPIESRPWWPAVIELEALLNALNPLAVFAATARERVEAELLRRRGLTFDGMLSRLAERIEREGGARSPLAGAIRARFDAVFVDEFQDTDAAQWTTLRAAFHGHRRLFLIGDPKQAIFGFRGADVHVYQRAAERVDAAHRRTMRDNWRSDPASVDASNALWREGSHAFEDAAIDYVRVEAKRGPRLAAPARSRRGPGAVPGLDVRWVDARVLSGERGAGRGIENKGQIPLPRLVAREVLAWLGQERARLTVDGKALDEEPPPPPRDVVPGDLAVIVGTHRQADALRRALAVVGVPAVAASKASVYESAAAEWLMAWLDAVAGGGRSRAARRAAITPLFGWSVRELAWSLARAGEASAASPDAPAHGEPEHDWNRWTARLRRAAERWERQGFSRVFDREARECGVYERLLARVGGERDATDVRHLFELLNAEDRRARSSPGSLAAWLRDQAAESKEEQAQRLESDEDAVRIVTVHASKGLEYPIVLLPHAWERRRPRDEDGPLLLRDGETTRLGLWRPGTPERNRDQEQLAEEERREEIRKLYVTLTRAAHQTVVWFGPLGSEGLDTAASALGRLLLRGSADDPSQAEFPRFPRAKDDADGTLSAAAMREAERRLNELAKRSSGIVWSAEPKPPEAPDPRYVTRASSDGEAPLRVAAWPGVSLHGPWQRTSFSRLSRAAREASGELDEPWRDEDQPDDGGLEGDEAPRAERGLPSHGLGPAPGPAAGDAATVAAPGAAGPELGGGKLYGSFVHEVLEVLDFASAQGDAAPVGKDTSTLAALLAERGPRWGFAADSAPSKELLQTLPAVLHTPLDSTADGPPALPSGFCLATLAERDRADELRFDLRLGAGSAWRRPKRGRDPKPSGPLGRHPGCVDPAAVSDALRRQPAPPGSPLALWLAAEAERRVIPSVTGLLSGTIDLLLRVGYGAERRYLVVDYKTNRIRSGEASRYDQAALEWEMARAGYFLQSLVYTLALHRHLSLRLRGYDYDRDVGGYLYLFLRGMGGPTTRRDAASGRCLGVYPGRWTREVVEALDAALSPGEVTP